jgi:hypothetical protein
MNLQSLDVAAAARADQAFAAAPAAFEAMQGTAKGMLMYLLSGRPLSVTAASVIFALPVPIAETRSQQDYLAACEELLAEGAIDHYVFVNHTDHCRADNGSLERIDTSLDTPMVIAVRRRSAESTRIGPAAL